VIWKLLFMFDSTEQTHECLIIILVMLYLAPVHERILIAINTVMGRHRLNSNIK